MVSYRIVAILLGLALSLSACDSGQKKPSRISDNQGQSQGSGGSNQGGASVPADPCYPTAKSAAKPAALGLASAAYEQINTAILKETCAANSCHGPESDFRPWVDNEPNFIRVAARVRFRILNKNRKHYFPPEKISDDNYRLLKQYVDGIPNSDLPAGCVVDYRP